MYFNESAATFKRVIETRNVSLVPALKELQAALSAKLLSLKIYYDELGYTSIEEKAKTSLIDLISGMGGTLVKIYDIIYL
jgi:hypothetical protein